MNNFQILFIALLTQPLTQNITKLPNINQINIPITNLIPPSYKSPKISGISRVRCNRIRQCQDGQTCCLNTFNRYNCCPFPQAVCCKDRKTCCKNEFPICDQAQNLCWINDCKCQVDISQMTLGIQMCDFYKKTQWLPPDYAAAAICACQGNNDQAWLSPSATCVRNNLLKAHQNLSPQLKQQSLEIINKYYGSQDLQDQAKYTSWMYANMLNPIYNMHVQAYSNCCCNGKPAAKIYWALIIQFGGFIGLNCKWVHDAIESKGACKCQGW